MSETLKDMFEEMFKSELMEEQEQREFIALRERMGSLVGHDGFKAFLETVQNDIKSFDAIIDNLMLQDKQAVAAAAQRFYARVILNRLEAVLAWKAEGEGDEIEE